MTVLAGIPATRVERLWPLVRPFVERALEHAGGRYAAEDVAAALLDRRMQLWAAVDDGGVQAVLVTEIVGYPRQRRCNLFLSAGNALDACLEHLAEIEAWARDQGCAAIEAGGRRGWERVLPGYRRTHVMLEKKLSAVSDQPSRQVADG